MGLALDESREEDLVFDDRGLTYVIDKDLFEKARPIKVDYMQSHTNAGFSITSSIKKDTSCAGSCSC